MPGFKPIKQSRVSEEVLAQLKEAIVRGRFKNGEKLPSERELTEEFQVSRGVVREAIRTLENAGFVEIRQGPSGGAFVTEMTFESLSDGFLDLYLANKFSITELNQVRMHIEPEVARLAALRIDDSHKQKLLEAAREEGKPLVSKREYMRRLTAIHFTLAEMCGNYLFEAIVNSIIRLTHEIVAAVDPVDFAGVHPPGEHDEIVRAVIAGRPEEAAQAMRRHLEGFSSILVKMDGAFRGLFKE